ncbi:hypothetical protein PR202_gb09066 [Eleusine coracana subsp. coracana]|uniref:Uncharacterized protein n=1 Tax=Eleusine coracana subsp. coracana TaxID=191504 RepID=A0AAV5EEL5_ELECO|nr:hypothetical protein PR202_gb09066 [Eleusine coracana subsp. coracana]
MGKSRGERRVIFSSSGAIQTTSASHRRRLLTGTATRARATAPEPDAAAETPSVPGAVATGGAAAGAERHHADAMGEEAQGRALLRLSRALDSLGVLWVEKSGWNLGAVRSRVKGAPAALRDRLVRAGTIRVGIEC